MTPEEANDALIQCALLKKAIIRLENRAIRCIWRDFQEVIVDQAPTLTLVKSNITPTGDDS